MLILFLIGEKKVSVKGAFVSCNEQQKLVFGINELRKNNNNKFINI